MSVNPNYDSDFCGKVPIHLINTVQPYGMLLVLSRPALEIIQVSENCAAIFDLAARDLIHSSLADHLDPASLASLDGMINGNSTDKVPQIWTIRGHQYLSLIHIKESYILVELETEPFREETQRSFVSVYQEIKYSMALIENAVSINDICSIASKELRRISGFDKVMIYRFDEDWNGNVLAEEKDPDMESYFGFTFPASDIPRQARDLYLRNPYRFIPDRTYTPVKLYPVINPVTRTFLDMSGCNVRGIVAVHLEYLANMGVTASMSTRILTNDRLWGLIACHHKTAKPMPFQLCAVFELLSNIISAKLQSLHNKERHEALTNSQSTYSRIVEKVYETNDLRAALLDARPSVLELFNARGAILVSGGELSAKGDTPRREDLDELLLWLNSRRLTRNLYTDRLSTQFDQAAPFRETASGLLAIPFNPESEQYVLLFRPETQRVIEWGGDPGGRIVFEKDGTNYHPRNSFRMWRETISGVSEPWREEELTTAESLRSFLYEYAAK